MKRRVFLLGAAAIAACWIFRTAAAAVEQEPPETRAAESPVTPANGKAPPGADKQQGEAPPEAAKGERLPLSENLKLKFKESWTDTFWRANWPVRWALLVLMIFLGLAAGWIATLVLGRFAKRFQARGWDIWGHLLEDLIGPGKLALFSVGLSLGLAGLKELPGDLQNFSWNTLLLLYSIAVFWYAFNLVAVVDIALRRLTTKTESTLDDQLVPLIRKTLRVFLVVIGVMFVVDSVFKQDIAAWLAGLGIAGIAVSLAARPSLENLFGSITILFDQPFKIGERIVYAGYDGIIEEIGFRSTKVRTLTGHLVTIPNAKIVSDPVENIGRRPYIRRIMNVTITYDTPREKIEQAVQILRDVMAEEGIREPIHATIDGGEYPPRVYFNDYNAESLNVIVIYWFAPPAYWDYLEHAQRLNLRIFEEFEKAGIEFAFPTQTLYLAGDSKRELAIKMLGKEL